MRLQVTSLRKRLVAHRAVIGFLPSVNALVVAQADLEAERLRAH